MRCGLDPPCGFYAWAKRGLSARAQRDLILRTTARAFFTVSRQSDGRPRLWKDVREDGEAANVLARQTGGTRYRRRSSSLPHRLRYRLAWDHERRRVSAQRS